MAINLSRNTLVYFTTNVDSAGKVYDPAGTTSGTSVSNASNANNTFQISVLDGYSFSQATTQSTIQISEAGDSPSRGQRAFNTALNPVDFTFSTYIRPSLTAAAGPVTAAEKVLWNALLGQNKLDTTGATITGLTRSTTAGSVGSISFAAALTKIDNDSPTATSVVVGDIINITGITDDVSYNQPVKISAVSTSTGTYSIEYSIAPTINTTAVVAGSKAYTGQWAQGNTSTSATNNHSYVSTMGSGKNQLQKFGMIFVVDNVTYAIDNCAMDQVSVDFGLDAIAMAAWTGKGTTLRAITGTVTAAAATTKAGYITNKLSTMTLVNKINGTDNATAGSAYSIPITGGNITIANNIAYQTPTNLAVVNVPIGYYTGQRSVTGNVTAYLRTGGSNDSGALLSSLLTAATTSAGVEPKYKVVLEMGGKNAANKVEFEMPAVVLQIPAVNVADVVATTINFNAQGFTADPALQTYDITNNNDLILRYYSNTSTA